MAQIVIQNIRKEFGDFVAVQESSFTIEDGEFFMLLGPSGCGKTTTLRMIAGLELPTSGNIFLDGEDISQLRPSQRDIAFVFQMFALYPHMNVRKNLSYPLASQGMPRAQIKAKVAEVADILGIGDIFIGSPSMNFLDFEGSLGVQDTSINLSGQAVTVPAMREAFSGDLVFGVRPEHIQLKDDAQLRAKVLAAEYLGTTQILTLETASGELKARVSSELDVTVGGNVGLDFRSECVTLFDKASGRALRSELNEGVIAHG